MAVSVLPTKEFVKDFRRLDEQVKTRVRQKIEEVANDPTRYKHLHYALRESSRVRIGHLRIVFSYDIGRRELYLEKIISDHEYRR